MATFKNVEVTEDELLSLIEQKTGGTISRVWRSGAGATKTRLNLSFREKGINDKLLDKSIGFAYDMKYGHIAYSNLPDDEKSGYEIEELYSHAHPDTSVVGVSPNYNYTAFTLKVRKGL